MASLRTVAALAGTRKFIAALLDRFTFRQLLIDMKHFMCFAKILRGILIMKQLVTGAICALAVSASGLAVADAGGIPNAAACDPGNASFCPPNGGTVPEIDGAVLPLGLGLSAALVFWMRDRRKSGKVR